MLLVEALRFHDVPDQRVEHRQRQARRADDRQLLRVRACSGEAESERRLRARRSRAVTSSTWTRLPFGVGLILAARAAAAQASSRLAALLPTLLAFHLHANDLARWPGDEMPHITSQDGTRLYYEEAGSGTPVVFVHEYAADYRTWEPQMRHFARSHRCVTYSQRGYPPSDVPDEPEQVSPGHFPRRRDRGDGCAQDRQGARGRPLDGRRDGAACRHQISAALHLGHRRRLRLWLEPRSEKGRGDRAPPRARTARCSPTSTMAEAARKYGDGPTRQSHKNKDPRGYAHFVKMLSEHSAHRPCADDGQSAGQAPDACRTWKRT